MEVHFLKAFDFQWIKNIDHRYHEKISIDSGNVIVVMFHKAKNFLKKKYEDYDEYEEIKGVYFGRESFDHGTFEIM